MKNEKLAEQALLASEILRTGHPWQRWHVSDQIWHDADDEENPCHYAANPTYQIRIKPEPAFTLPPPPPGMSWHREDGWKDGDLPQGWRPLALEEHSTNQTEQRYSGGWMKLSDSIIADPLEDHCRTKRPLTFTHEGKTWTWHRPGDPRPVDGNVKIEVLYGRDKPKTRADYPSGCKWSDGTSIIGWRYAETKIIPLGPGDVPPSSVFRLLKTDIMCPVWIKTHGVCCYSEFLERFEVRTWEQLKEKHEINRSIPQTGKWNPDAWEACEKNE